MAIYKNKTSFIDYKSYAAQLAKIIEGLPLVTVITGSNSYLRRSSQQKIQANLLATYSNLSIVSLTGATDNKQQLASQLSTELSSNSIFSKHKLIVLTAAEKLLFDNKSSSQDEQDEKNSCRNKRTVLDIIISHLNKPLSTTWLVIDTEVFQKNRIISKELSAKAAILECPNLNAIETTIWLQERLSLEKLTIASDAADLLVQAYANDLDLLASELEKLCLYIKEKSSIALSDVREFFHGNLEFDIFSLTNAIEERNMTKALLFSRKITTQGLRDATGKKNDGLRSAHRALAMLSSTVQQLLQTSLAVKDLGSSNQAALAKELGVSPWRVSKLITAAKKYSFTELKTMLKLLTTRIQETHDTASDPLLTLELLAVELTKKVNFAHS